jgi:protein tyrosine phosphatase domain-containing protein 1
MQRPSDRLIKQYSLIQKFKELNINTILNLQEPGEHPYCGDGLLPKVGFSYNPERLFTHGIMFFNESWEDMTATTFEHMMRIMDVFYVAIVKEKGKIAVHCHAGRGRTLLVICSWLVYYLRMSARASIELAGSKREGVLTKDSQRQFLADF